jgi:hypothetical protein
MLTEDSAINVPAVAAAHVIKRYTAQASDEISFEVRKHTTIYTYKKFLTEPTMAGKEWSATWNECFTNAHHLCIAVNVLLCCGVPLKKLA